MKEESKEKLKLTLNKTIDVSRKAAVKVKDTTINAANKTKDMVVNTYDKTTKVDVDINNRRPLVVPMPIINKDEEKIININKTALEKMTKENIVDKTKNKISEIIPDSFKSGAKNVGEKISGAELFKKCLDVISDGFTQIEKYAAKVTLTPEYIINSVNEVTDTNDIASLDEICLARCNDIDKLVSSYKQKDYVLALGEGAGTGFFGFAGIPFNIVLSTFIYYRAVQTVAMYYGYDAKNNEHELEIVGDVFMKALSPKNETLTEGSAVVAKIVALSEVTTIKQTCSSWEKMAANGGVTLAIAQMRALSNAAAKKALNKATNSAANALETSAFKNVFKQIGKTLSQDAVKGSVPIIGAVIAGAIDSYQMKKIIEYANIFYSNRFLVEKEARIKDLPIVVHDNE